ncbi:hypothetical protein F0562_023845 [Nyssa sinensis]|uniref:Uncharacterized protein n=1 Tax=Nyssa sinensis TaxID=561372 RepID=A0A5J5BJ21_9ASTE|nr:hypothetical protein F0562_023845 [Nyssa sinensis]
MSSFVQFANTTKLMQPHFEQAIESLPSVSCIISDGFLGWTQQSAAKLGIPRLVSYGMNNFALAICEIVILERPQSGVSSDDEPFPVPSFPRLKITRNDFEPPFHQEADLKDPHTQFIFEQRLAVSKSHGLHLNARMVVEELGIGLRIMSRNGSVRGAVESPEVEKMARELMEGERGEQVRKKVKEVGENACGAMREGGSSRRTIDMLIHEVSGFSKST